ncbi:GatB YqeY domain-containing protein [Coniophora puteana RWD-64-598 SS2]|uniref:Altered inheritance of mitochondria protein 41 n=1 Tax=Coniophora puteana (strain RWD-64-598) TaxID=741705 RepID=A0A5M3MV55_CONPW|nr:GatB YqeY domain-containing protein [Coniophora puteana RWD-64-598 SS2]EIW82887.1 GatB YqeY domain-containing protein [Coniophora puteana RWD-64-598 SS2]
MADMRERLQSAVKTAMKSKDTATSTTLRSILSEVYARDKGTDGKAAPSVILEIMRKATTRRTDAAIEFEKASRPDLAEKERKEAALISDFLPPLLTEAQVDEVLNNIFKEHPLGSGDPRKHLGQVYKIFYSQIERFQVDPNLVKERAQALATNQS